MPITVKCAGGHTLKVPRKFAGKKVKCPKCGQAARVPAVSTVAPDELGTDSPAAVATPPARKNTPSAAESPTKDARRKPSAADGQSSTRAPHNAMDEVETAESSPPDDTDAYDDDEFGDEYLDGGPNDLDEYDPGVRLPPKRGQRKKKKVKKEAPSEESLDSDKPTLGRNQVIALGVAVGATSALVVLMVIAAILPGHSS